MPGTFKSLWHLDKKISYLNHGSFGACPIAILEQQQQLRAKMEKNPMQFFVREFFDLVDQARASLASFVGASEKNLVFVCNATSGVNAILRSLDLKAGEEILVTDHGYGACNNAAFYTAREKNLKINIAQIPFPTTEEQIIESIVKKISAKTRFAILDHIASATALIFPIKNLIQKLQSMGIEVLIDGAHAPGMLELNLKQLAPCYYTGNCHKWLCSPKGAAFLYICDKKINKVLPNVISHGNKFPVETRLGYHNFFDWPGTHDPTAYLSVPFAIEYMASLVKQGWKGIYESNHQKVIKASQWICNELTIKMPAAEELFASMVTLILPFHHKYISEPKTFVHPLQKLLLQKSIEVQITSWHRELLFLRISAQLYNEEQEYKILANILKEIYFS